MNPYQKLPNSAFWKTAVASRLMFDVEDIWEPKFEILSIGNTQLFSSST